LKLAVCDNSSELPDETRQSCSLGIHDGTPLRAYCARLCGQRIINGEPKPGNFRAAVSVGSGTIGSRVRVEHAMPINASLDHNQQVLAAMERAGMSPELAQRLSTQEDCCGRPRLK